MNAMHKLISFQSGPASALPNFAILLAASIGAGILAVRYFRYE